MLTLDTSDVILAAVLAEPGEDFHRRAYADWLEENGQVERAEFIRVQVELAGDFATVNHDGIKAGLTDGGRRRHPRFAHLVRREKELLASNTFFDPPSWLHEWWFRRGFVAEVSLPLAAWLAHGKALVRQHPLEKVTLSDRAPTPKAGTDWGWYKRDPGGRLSGEEAELPADLWDLLRGGKRKRDRQYDAGIWRNYHTLELANAALSAACLAWAKGDS